MDDLAGTHRAEALGRRLEDRDLVRIDEGVLTVWRRNGTGRLLAAALTAGGGGAWSQVHVEVPSDQELDWMRSSGALDLPLDPRSPLPVVRLSPETSSEAEIDLEPESFGSQSILEHCWSPRVLAGSPSDRMLYGIDSPQYFDREPPLRRQPANLASPLPKRLRGSIRRVHLPAGTKLVALTFDLCEMASDVTGYDADLVNYLRRNRVKATFFAGGKWMRSHPEKTMQLMADPLFELGNHAWTHGNLRYLKGRDVEDQILWTQAQYELLREDLARSACVARAGAGEIEKIPDRLRTFRFPFGTCSQETLDTLAELGLPAIQWDVLTADPSRKVGAGRIAAKILSRVRPGSIVIAHANGRGWHTAMALAQVIPKLKRRGYGFATVSELLAVGSAESVRSCYWEKPGDNGYVNRRYGGGTEKPWPFRR